jgi:Tat protein translocase TatB subunit
MFNIGPQELLIILIVALVVVGPKRLPELGRTIGRGLNEFRKLQDEVRDMVKFDLGGDAFMNPPDVYEPDTETETDPPGAEAPEPDQEPDPEPNPEPMTHSQRVVSLAEPDPDPVDAGDEAVGHDDGQPHSPPAAAAE